MNVGTIARLSIIPLLAIMLFYHARQLSTSKTKPSLYSAGLLSLTVSLIVIATIAALVEPPHIASVMITTFTTHQGVLIAYFAIDQLNKDYIPKRVFVFTKRYIISTFATMGVLVLEWLRRDNLGSFIDNDPFQPTAIYYAAYACNFAVPFFLSIEVTKLTWRTARNPLAAPTYKVRNYLSGWSFVWIAAGPVIVEINLLVTAIAGDVYRDELNVLYHAQKPIVCVFLLISSAPTRILQIPTQLYLRYQRNQQEKLLTYLRNKLMDIVPTLQLDMEGLQAAGLEVELEDRMVNEIGDARELVYSHHVPQEVWKAPEEEAKLLHNLLQKQAVIEKAGKYGQPDEHVDLLGHNIAVAKHLKKLERAWLQQHIINLHQFLN